MALIATSLNLGTLNDDGTFTAPSAAIGQGTGVLTAGIKSALNTRVFYDGSATTMELTSGVATELDNNGVITGTDCTYATGTLTAGNTTTSATGASINLDRSMLMITNTGAASGSNGVVQFNTTGGFNVTNSQVMFTHRDYGNTRLQFNIRGTGGVDLTNTTIQPGFRDTGNGTIELALRVAATDANLAGLTLGFGVFFQPHAQLTLPQVTFSAIPNTGADALRTIIDATTGNMDVGYVPYWDCSFEAWAATNRLSLQSNEALGQQVNLWIVNGTFPAGGTTLIVRGNSAGDGVARSVSAWRPLFSVQPNTDASIDFISSPTGVFLKPVTTVTLGTSGVPTTHAVATSDIPDTSANNTNGYLIQPNATVSPANNVNANLTRSDISAQQVRIWDYANNTPWLIDGLTETPTSNLNDGNAANGTFAAGAGQQINNAIDGLITEDNIITAAALATGSLDDLYQAMKARWTTDRTAAPFNNITVGDEATLEEIVDLSAAGRLNFGSRSVTFANSSVFTATNTLLTVGIASTPQLTAGTFFNTIVTTGTLTMDNTLASGVSVSAGTLANLPTTLGDGTVWAGTFTTTSATDVTYDMAGADISELVFINNGTGTVSIVGAAESDFDTAPAGTGTVVFPFALTIDSSVTDTDGLISVYFDDVLQTTAGTYQLSASTVVDVIYTEPGRTDFLQRSTVDSATTITIANSDNLYPDSTADTSGLFTLATPVAGSMDITVNSTETSSGVVNDALQEHVKATANYNLLIQQTQVTDIVTSLGIESNAQLNSDHINLVSSSPVTLGFVSASGTGTLTSTTSVDASSLGLGTLEIGVTINGPAAFDPGITAGQINDAFNRSSDRENANHEATRSLITSEHNVTRLNTDAATSA